MSQPNVILDYASPRKRSPLRMASASLLRHEWVDGGLVVHERLHDQAQAIAVIVVSALPLLMMIGRLFDSPWRGTPMVALAFPAAVMLGWLAAILMVVQQSWTRTELTLRDRTLRLRMGGPLSRRVFERTFDQVHAVRVIPMEVGEDNAGLGEIEILVERIPPVRLFTDHPEWRLAVIGRAIDLALKGQRPELLST